MRTGTTLKGAVLLAAALLLAVVAGGCAQKGAKARDYPNKPVTMIQIFTAGGPLDVQSRVVEKYWKEYFNNQPLVFDYKVGAGGQVGMTEIARANPDGYTIGGFSFPHIVLQSLGPQATFKLEDFAFIAQLVCDPTVLAVNKNSTIKTLSDFIAEANRKNGEMTVGIVGTLSGHHLALLKMTDLLNIKVKPVVFPGSADCNTALRGGHIDAQVGNLTDVIRNQDAFRPIAIASEKRHPWLPDVPTFRELGYDLISDVRRGYAAPAGIDPAILKKLRDGITAICQKPEYLEDMKKAGLWVEFMSGEEFYQFAARFREEALAIIQKHGLI